MRFFGIKTARFTFVSLCFVLAGWLALTICLEVSWGMPTSTQQWTHRAMGWFVQLVLLRTFMAGYRRHQRALAG